MDLGSSSAWHHARVYGTPNFLLILDQVNFLEILSLLGTSEQFEVFYVELNFEVELVVSVGCSAPLSKERSQSPFVLHQQMLTRVALSLVRTGAKRLFLDNFNAIF